MVSKDSTSLAPIPIVTKNLLLLLWQWVLCHMRSLSSLERLSHRQVNVGDPFRGRLYWHYSFLDRPFITWLEKSDPEGGFLIGRMGHYIPQSVPFKLWLQCLVCYTCGTSTSNPDGGANVLDMSCNWRVLPKPPELEQWSTTCPSILTWKVDQFLFTRAPREPVKDPWRNW